MSGNQQQAFGGTISLENDFLRFYLESLKSFQGTWLGPDGFQQDQYNRQLLFLISLIPDQDKQSSLLETWGSAQLEYKKIPGLSNEESQFYVGQKVTTEIILFITQSLDLVNSDVIGPGTSKEFEQPLSEKRYKRLEVLMPDLPGDGDVIDLE